MYIHQKSSWPTFRWDIEAVSTLLASVRNKQGKLIGRMESLGFTLQKEAVLQTLTLDALKSNEIEGEILDADQVRSSIARRLGIDIATSAPFNRNVEGVIEMLLDATQHYIKPLTEDRLFGWHAALFPSGRSGLYKITVGRWRDHTTGPMQVVSGAMGREQVHFEAPSAERVPAEMKLFINWYNENQDQDPVLKAAIVHLWFVTIHPFDDGNGRIARSLTDMQLARSDGSSQRFYSMSAQIQLERKHYYEILERTQKDNLDITAWLIWFLNCMDSALSSTQNVLTAVVSKAQYWNLFSSKSISERQKIMLNKLLDGFEGKLNTSKWAKITKISPDTALRDIQNLVDQGILEKENSGGRSTSYKLVDL
jgi:Fic family protein